MNEFETASTNKCIFDLRKDQQKISSFMKHKDNTTITE